MATSPWRLQEWEQHRLGVAVDSTSQRRLPNCPKGPIHIAGGIAPEDLEEATLGWLLSQYRFDRYRAQPAARAALQTPATVDAAKVIAMAEGEFLTRAFDQHACIRHGPTRRRSCGA